MLFRSGEATLLTWDDVEDCAVTIPGGITKTGAGRSFTLPAAACRRLRAWREGTAIPPLAAPTPVGHAAVLQLAGRYVSGDEWLDLLPKGNDLVFDPCIGIATVQRSLGQSLVSQDPASLGDRVLSVKAPGTIHDGIADFRRVEIPCPPEPPPELAALVGEYGFAHAQVLIYEVRGRLGILLDGHVRDLPNPVGKDRYVLPAGTHGGDELVFVRAADGAVTGLFLGAVHWPRIVHPPDGAFRIPLRAPLAQLRLAIRDLHPPPTEGAVRKPDLVDLRVQQPPLRFDLRYASAHNFLGEPVYEPNAIPMLQREAAAALQKAHEELRAQGFGLCVFDGYRPW